jgi:hypothetical protein
LAAREFCYDGNEFEFICTGPFLEIIKYLVAPGLGYDYTGSPFRGGNKYLASEEFDYDNYNYKRVCW